MHLQGRVALVTGASRGIGAATARALAGHGAAVAVNYFQSREAADHVVGQIVATGGRALAGDEGGFVSGAYLPVSGGNLLM